ncbi:hypothetical protein AB0M29_35000 [Streptomyces sp. NPDC051976]|uniref:hypothetical protein n=1 Tax=Streptomyces sp. NPDC051976 TaxID=3154947 RepID=UPI00342688E5
MAPNDRYRGDHLPLVGADILNLPSLQLQKIALTRIAQLASGEINGKPLTRDLRGCFKLYFDEQENDVGRRLNRPAPGYRIVYRLLPPVEDPPDRDTRPPLQVLAVGPRARQDAYERAAARMARPEVQPEAEQPSPRSTGPDQRRGRPQSEAEQLRQAPRPQQHRPL